MWKKYLIILIVIFISTVIGGKKKKSDSDCQRTNKEAFRYCTRSCSSASDCNSNQKCLCDEDCGMSCVRNNLRCEALSKSKNSRQKSSNGRSFNSVVTYRCKPPFQLRGSSTRTCRATAKWDGKKARCKIECKDPGEISFGNRRVDGLQAGKHIQYWCFDNSYNLIGSARIECLETGEWSAPKPKCELPQCDPPKIPDSAIVYYPRRMNKTFRYSDRVLLKCKDGYFKSRGGVLSCQGSKQWTGDIKCSPKSCGRPRDVSNGKIIGYLYSFKEKVRYVCNEGYKLNGPAYRICQANEEWGDSEPTCEVVDCGPLDKPDHGDIIEQVGLTFGNRIVFECKDKGYELSGSRIRTCQSDGTWSGTLATCDIVQCGDPGKPANGAQKVNKGFVYGGSVEFICDKNYTLSDSPTIYCQENKEWTGSVPQCLDCGAGLPLGMESRKIPDTSIKASSQIAQHPAYHVRLGGDSYWCSEEGKADFIHINLPKKYKITGARIQLKSEYEIKSIVLKGKILQDWVDSHYEQLSKNKEVELQIKAKHPFIAQSVRIRVLKLRRESICLRAEVYGCGIPRGCIMRGSAVIIKQKDRYQCGFIGEFISTKADLLELFLPGQRNSIIVTRADVVQDEKPDVHELSIGKLVLGEDVTSPGLIRKGKIEQITDSVCTIKTNDETWKSGIKDIRIVKIPAFCS